MGTNYYFEPRPPCCECKRPFDKIHIGKSSAGWCFSLHVGNGPGDWTFPDDFAQPASLEDWIAIWKSGGRIVNEYGDAVSIESMIAVISGREGRPFDGRDWMGYGSEAAFHASNHSERGPKGLLRHRIDGPEHGTRCIRHGSGTWDLLVGEWS